MTPPHAAEPERDAAVPDAAPDAAVPDARAAGAGRAAGAALGPGAHAQGAHHPEADAPDAAVQGAHAADAGRAAGAPRGRSAHDLEADADAGRAAGSAWVPDEHRPGGDQPRAGRPGSDEPVGPDSTATTESASAEARPVADGPTREQRGGDVPTGGGAGMSGAGSGDSEGGGSQAAGREDGGADDTASDARLPGTGTREESGGHSPHDGTAQGGDDAPRDVGGPTGGGSPAEAARRALRVARALARPAVPAERAPAPSDTRSLAADGATAPASADGPAGARPSAAARAAIRRRGPVAETDPGGTRPGEDAGSAPQDADAAPGVAGGAGPAKSTEPPTPPQPPNGEPSPAERAREALRAARAAAEPAHAPGGTAPTGDPSEAAPAVADQGDDEAAAPAPRTSTPAARAWKAATAPAPDRSNQSPAPAPSDAEPDDAEPDDAAAHDVNGTSRHRGMPPRDLRPVQDALPHDPPAPPTTRPRGVGDDHRKTFDRLPPREEGAALAETPWGEAWLTALTERALDPARLARGRRYAEGGRVDSITVTPGLAIAYVHGSRPRPYRAQVRVRTLDDDEWEAFLDAVAERPAHIAALLDRRLPEALLDGGVGAPLLPRRGDLLPFCGCPDTGRPCKHAAALCYQTARLLDADPFALLLLRGRGEREILDALSRRNAAHAARAAAEARASRRRDGGVPEGLRAKDALARAASGLPPLPAPLPPPEHPGQPPAYPAAPGGPDPYALDQLATHAAVRAHALLTTGEDPVGGLTLWQDAVRIAAARPGSGLTAATRTLYSSLAAAAGRTPVELARAVAAWRQGGPAGLAVLEGEPWDPPAGRFDRARPLLLAAGLEPFRPWRNRLTHLVGHAQIRLGQDNLWYAYESEPGADDWWPRGTADADPVAALSALGPGLDPAELPPEPRHPHH